MTDEGGTKTSDLTRRIIAGDIVDEEVRADLERLTESDVDDMDRLIVWHFGIDEMVSKVQDKLNVKKKTARKLVRQRLADYGSIVKDDIKDILRLEILMGLKRRSIIRQMALAKGDYEAVRRLEDSILKVGEFFGANEPVQVEHTVDDRRAEVLDMLRKKLKLDEPGE